MYQSLGTKTEMESEAPEQTDMRRSPLSYGSGLLYMQ